MSVAAKPKKEKKDKGLRYDGRKLTGKLYLSKLCPHCKKVFAQIDQVKKNFAEHGIEIYVEFIDESKEFYAHDFDSVPTLVIPFQRPFTAIGEAWLVDPDKVRKLVLGEVTADEMKHETAKEREQKGIPRSEKWWKPK